MYRSFIWYRRFRVNNVVALIRKSFLVKTIVWMLFYRFARPSYVSSSTSTHPFCLFAIESRRGSMTRDDSLARMCPVIAMWYKIRTANRDEENSPDERWTVVLYVTYRSNIIGMHRRLFMQMMHRCDCKSIADIYYQKLFINIKNWILCECTMLKYHRRH